MALANANSVVQQVCYDDANHAKIKLTAFFLGGTGSASNTKIQANTLFGANLAAQLCILDVLRIEGQVGMNGSGELVALQFAGNSGTTDNTDIALWSGDGATVSIDGYIPNNAANVANGDLNLMILNPVGGTSLTLILTLQKNNLGILQANGGQLGAGGWANGFVNT